MTILALLAGCGDPAPSTSAATEPSSSGLPGPSGSPGPTTSLPTEPDATPAPADGDWVAGVELLPLAPIASLEPTLTSSAGVLPDTRFRLTTSDGSDPVRLARSLEVTPRVPFTVAAVDGAAIVTPRTPLAKGATYRFVLRGAGGTIAGSWAVQAVANLAVTSLLPEDGSTEVPMDTGIEIRFNQAGVSVADLERFVVIRPATPGRFELDGRTAAFVPDAPLQRDTMYTLTVRAGLPLVGSAETLAHDVVARFATQGSVVHRLWMRMVDDVVESRPADRAVLGIELDTFDGETPSTPPTVSVTVHRLSNQEAAVEAWRVIAVSPTWSQAYAPPMDTSGLPLELSADVELATASEDEWSWYLVLPRPLDAGWYVVTATAGGGRAQAVLQVTDLALYSVVTTTRSLAWVNDLATGEPVEGATITVAGDRIGRTGGDGIAVGATPAKLLHAGSTVDEDEDTPVLDVVVARTAQLSVFAPIGEGLCGKCEGTAVASRWVVFTTDRYEYRSTDTIHAWGIVRDRTTGRVPKQVTVTLSSWASGDLPATALVTAKVTPDRQGAFVADLAIAELPYGEYETKLWVDGVSISERGVSVARILKPAWSMALTPSKRAVVEGDTIRVTADAAFFEGTPVAGAAITMSAGGRSATLVTGSTGSGSARVRVRRDGSWDQWGPIWVSAHPKAPEEGQISAGTWVAAFEADVIIQSKSTIEDGRLRIAGTVHDVAFSRFEAASDESIHDIDPLGPPAAGVPVTIRVVEQYFVRTQVGTTYDWILKRVVPRYETTVKKIDRGTFTRSTDAAGRFELNLDTSPDRSYRIRVSARDASGRVTADDWWAEAAVTERPDEGARITARDPGGDGWSVGEPVRLVFSGGAGAGAPATYLWTTAHEGLRSWTLTSVPRTVDRLNAADVPNFTVDAVRLTGSGYVVAAWEQRIGLRVEDRRLDVAITTDQSRYRPGDRATISVRTRDAAGNGVPASVYVGVVDERLVAMGSVDLSDPLWSLYEDVGSGILGVGWTHRSPGTEMGAEGGDTTGGGGEAPRTDFRDWLLARIVRTGADGRATVAVDLSDDLTSWHVTAAAVSQALLAGRGDAKIAVSLPFFAEVTVADSYLVADAPIVRVRAYGTGLDAGDIVTFRVSSGTLPLAPITATAPAFQAAEIALPPLSVGTHRLRVEARTGSGQTARMDALVRTFTVVERRAVSSVVSRTELTSPMSIPAGGGFTVVTLADGGRGRVVPILEELAAEPFNRGDRALAAGVAARVLRDSFGVDDDQALIEADLGAFVGGEGLQIVPYGGGSMELSALAAMTGDPRLGHARDWFYDDTSLTREDRLWFLAGLAATGQPALAEIRVAAEQTDLTVDEQIALAIAALAAGDEALAARLERAVLRAEGQRRGPWVRIGGIDSDVSVVRTARLAIVAASLGEPIAADMDAYVSANPPVRTVVALERALAARGWAFRVPPSEASAILTVAGKASTLRIDASEPVELVLTPAQALAASLAPGLGSVVVAIKRDELLDPSTLHAPAWLMPVRSVSPNAVAFDSLVIVRLRMQTPPREADGCWVVTEWVPSGLVPIVSSAEDDDEGGGARAIEPYSVRGQRLDFCLEAGRRQRTVTLQYAARVVTPGRYAWEPTVVQSLLDPTAGSVIPATTITIRGER